MADALTLAEVNALDRDAFVERFGHVFEATPALAAAAHERAPFADRAALVRAFTDAADALDDDDALALLRAHPELGRRGPMAAASVAEQAGAGLDAEDPVVAEIRAGGEAYRERFGFPFIIAVRGLGRDEVAAALRARLANDEVTERARARREVAKIAALRLAEAVA